MTLAEWMKTIFIVLSLRSFKWAKHRHIHELYFIRERKRNDNNKYSDFHAQGCRLTSVSLSRSYIISNHPCWILVYDPDYRQCGQALSEWYVMLIESKRDYIWHVVDHNDKRYHQHKSTILQLYLTNTLIHGFLLNSIEAAWFFLIDLSVQLPSTAFYFIYARNSIVSLRSGP